MKHTLIFALPLTLLLLNAKCKRDDCEVVPGGKTYNAWVPVTYSPMQERFKIGDTLTIEVQVPNELTDTLTGEPLPMGDVMFDDVWGGNFGGVIARFFKTQQDSTTWVYAANEFDYVQINGVLHFTGGGLPALAVTLSGDAEKNRIAKFQMIPRRTGTYNLVLFSPYLDVTKQIGQYCAAVLNLDFGGPVAHNYHLLQDFDVTKVGTYEQNSGAFSFIVEE